MTAFEELKSEWNEQSRPKIPVGGANRILQKIDLVKKKQRITNAILGLTSSVLIGFFIYISAYKNQTVYLGLAMMLLALALRIGIELLSLKKLNRVDVLDDAGRFRQQLIDFYSKRKKIHFIITPLSILFYCVGFIILLPAFKATMSTGFYTYIIVSSIVLLVALGLFIALQIRKEMKILKELKGQN